MFQRGWVGVLSAMSDLLWAGRWRRFDETSGTYASPNRRQPNDRLTPRFRNRFLVGFTQPGEGFAGEVGLFDHREDQRFERAGRQPGEVHEDLGERAAVGHDGEEPPPKLAAS